MRALLPLLLFVLFALPCLAQDAPDLVLTVTPEVLQLEVGERTTVTAAVTDAEGKAMEDVQVMFFSQNRSALGVGRYTGEVMAFEHGDFTLMAALFTPQGRILKEVPVTVLPPPLEKVVFAEAPAQVYAGTTVSVHATAVDVRGRSREEVAVRMVSTAPALASLDAFGHLTAHATGTVTLRAEAEGLNASQTIEVVPNPIVALEIGDGPSEARTGDVIAFTATALDADGHAVADAPIRFTFDARPAETRAPAAAAMLKPDGRFVAEAPGLYTVMASVGNLTSSHTMRIVPRDVGREAMLVGQTSVDVYTSDIWVWEGVDGRDYAVTGTWGANGEAYFWDVTDKTQPTMIDTVTVDARTVNDVKVSEDGTLCVITREGASTRRNGLLLLDCTDPHDVKILSEYDENLTGGVHNVYIYENYVFALSAGQRYDILDVSDPTKPNRVGSFELDVPGHSIHDVWVEDGIAYSSNWSNGVYMVDVGNGIKGGSVENPVVIGHYAYPSGWNHAAFPYRSEDTGKFYVIAGDEHFLPPNRTPTGYIHIIDFTDPENPEEVARYEVPEAGTHNFWVEGDKLYVAYYQGGLRVVDLSGDLMGDLYKQGREIAKYSTEAADAFLPNKPRAWGVMPHKGFLFLADKHSGLWIIKVEEDEKEPAS